MAGIGVAVLGVALIGAAVLLATGGNDTDEAESDPATTATAELTQTLTKADAGLEARYPAGWTRSERRGIINLESPDHCAVVALSAPVPASQGGRLMEDLVGQLRRSAAKATVRREPSPVQIDGKPTESSIVALKTKQGAAAVVRISVTRGPELSHVAEVVIRGAQCEQSALAAGTILQSIDYER
jgi:hypothetical protein